MHFTDRDNYLLKSLRAECVSETIRPAHSCKETECWVKLGCIASIMLCLKINYNCKTEASYIFMIRDIT